jgi:phosphoserine phosphatase
MIRLRELIHQRSIALALRLFLLRHGETEWNKIGRFQGVSDIPINAEGHRQAQVLAESLQAELLQGIYSSFLCRARQTAEVIASLHNMNVNTRIDLHEMDLGELEGADREVFQNRYGALAAQWKEGPWNVQMPGGESLPQVQKRMWSALMAIAREHQSGTVAVVSHAFANAAVLCRAADLDITHFREFRQSPAARNLLEFENGSARVLLVNDLPYPNITK